MEKLLYTVEEAAEMLNVSRWTVFRLIKECRLVSVKVYSGRRIPAQALADYVAALVGDVA